MARSASERAGRRPRSPSGWPAQIGRTKTGSCCRSRLQPRTQRRYPNCKGRQECRVSWDENRREAQEAQGASGQDDLGLRWNKRCIQCRSPPRSLTLRFRNSSPGPVWPERQEQVRRASASSSIFAFLPICLSDCTSPRKRADSLCRAEHSVFFRQHDCDHALGDRRVRWVRRMASQCFIVVPDLEHDHVSVRIE